MLVNFLKQSTIPNLTALLQIPEIRNLTFGSSNTYVDLDTCNGSITHVKTKKISFL